MMQKTAAIFSTLVALGLLLTLSGNEKGGAFGQIQNLNCPNCITIPESQIDLYKELFPIVIWTDHTTYDHNSIVTVNGWLRENFLNSPITVNVFNPIGNVITVDQIMADSEGNFQFKFNTAGPLWKSDGSYIIKVQSGPESRVFKTKVELIPTSVGVVHKCSLYELSTPADNGGQYCIPYSFKNGVKGVDAFLQTQTKTLVIKPRAFGTGSFTIDIPRSVLDAKSGSQDAPFTILFNGKPSSFEELDSKSEDLRRIEIPVVAGTEGTIEIIGTTVVPEFGTIALMILVASMSSILFITKKSFIRIS